MDALHRAHLAALAPSPVTAFAADERCVAVGRENGNIEIWEPDTWDCIQTIPGTAATAATSLVWLPSPHKAARHRLLSAGLSGDIVEWNLRSLVPAAATDSAGGAIWAMAHRPAAAGEDAAMVAAACDDGCARVFLAEADEAGVQYHRRMPKTEGRVLSVAWHPAGSILVSGDSEGLVHCWEWETGRELVRLNVCDPGRVVQTCVWACVVLRDGTIVVGDATGCVTFVDGSDGTTIRAFRQHAADVLALASDAAGDRVFATGVDLQVSMFQRTGEAAGAVPGQGGTGTSTWVYTSSKRAHTHDVRCLGVVRTSAGETLLSGGNDGRVVVYEVGGFLDTHASRLPRSAGRTVVGHCAVGGADAVFCGDLDARTVDVWRLGSCEVPPAADEGASADLTAPPAHLLRIETPLPHALLCATVSPDCEHVVASDTKATRMFRVDASGDAPTVQRLGRGNSSRASQLPAARAAIVQQQRGRAVLMTLESGLVAVDLDTLEREEIDWRHVRATVGPRNPARLLATDPDEKWLVVATRHELHAYSCADGIKHHGRLPVPEGPITALSFSPDSELLAVGTASNYVALVDVQRRALSPLSEVFAGDVGDRIEAMPGDIMSLSFHPKRPSLLLIATPAAFCYVDLAVDQVQESQPAQPTRRRTRVREEPSAIGERGSNGRVLLLDSFCLHVGFSRTGQMTLLEVAREALETVPEPMYRPEFGNK
ncbi:unnamed protein product [Pedinophyceae sp. YPF-701]|nr:unnamed protein product [Pedinophyceae sp. YPF-701]